MKKLKYSLAAVISLFALSMAAQETYQDTKMIGNELNGTARYVGMGGAMEALGADVSTIGSNPAGIGLFRNNQVSVSGGFVAQSGETTSPKYGRLGMKIKGDKTNASLDQLGIVYVTRTGVNSYLNFGFNYHKSRNYNQILTAGNSLTIPSYINGLTVSASQNKLSAMKFPDATKYSWSGVDANYEQVMAISKDANGKQSMDYLNGTEYLFGQYQQGYIGEYDFNISGNIKDRVFLGFTLGLHDVHYNSNSYYTENLERNVHSSAWESLRISGVGVDFKFGAIFRPFDANAFRVGVYMNTPTWYDLTTSNYSTMTDGTTSVPTHESYDFRVDTPWKFGLSLGHTINNVVALGATYEYADYSAMSTRIKDGGYYDNWYGTYYESSHKDKAMNAHTQETLKGVHTLKLGAEFKVMPEWSVRLGYNYLSAMFNENGAKNGTIASPGSYYASSTSFVNWKATNRITCGVGYAHKNFNVDLAYQYSAQNGEYFPFANYYEGKTPSNEDNIATATKVNNKRHQLLLTLGYRF